MEEPLGHTIGNALEVMESVAILKGLHGDSDLARMSLRLAAEMVLVGGGAQTLAEAEARVAQCVAGGQAMAVFRDWVTCNGGDPRALDDFSLLPGYSESMDVTAPASGVIHAIDSRSLGMLAMELGAGRATRNAALDLGVGITVHARVGQAVRKGERLLTLHGNGRRGNPLPETWITIRPEPCEPAPWLLETVE